MHELNTGITMKCDEFHVQTSSLLGEGCFGKVYSVRIAGDKGRYAMKTVPISDNARYEEAKEEVKVLRLLSKTKAHKHHIVKMEIIFIHEINGAKYSCIVMERMGLSLAEFQKCRDYLPFPLKEVRAVGKQMLKALKYIHEIGIIHTDIKPSNILCALLTNDLQVKLADFGNADSLSGLMKEKDIQPLGFRAPEILVGLPFNERIDIFSLGCVLAELYSGKQIFPAETIYQLARFQFDLIGVPNEIHLGKRFRKLYEINGRTGKYEPSMEESKILDEVEDYRQYKMKDIRDLSKYGSTKNSLKQTLRFLDAIEELLAVDSQHRPSAKEALQLNFFRS